MNNNCRKYLNHRPASFTTSLEPVEHEHLATIPIYRVMDFYGKVVDGAHDPNLSPDVCVKMYKVSVNKNNKL